MTQFFVLFKTILYIRRKNIRSKRWPPLEMSDRIRLRDDVYVKHKLLDSSDIDWKRRHSVSVISAADTICTNRSRSFHLLFERRAGHISRIDINRFVPEGMINRLRFITINCLHYRVLLKVSEGHDEWNELAI